MLLRKSKHGLNKILTVAVKPGGSYHKILIGKILYEILSRKFCSSVSALGACRIEFFIRRCAVSRKYIIGGNVDQLCAHFSRCNGEIPGADGIDLHCQIFVLLASVDIGICSAVNYRIRIDIPDIGNEFIRLCDIYLIHIRSDILKSVILPKFDLECSSQLTIASGNDNLLAHFLFPSK
ncbi:MAG: hypothetical protein BWY61_00957 [Firmicutes bacterium ADurb.Bin354]|nr:MAG: hypothetical protein BWY61_00957 [Firmicutes bacterium ADurb.Bin354]